MIHTFTSCGKYMALDVGSGAVHALARSASGAMPRAFGVPGCCAAALFLVILHCGVQLREGDFAAIEDTWDAFTLCAAVLLAGTLALAGAAWLRGHRKG